MKHYYRWLVCLFLVGSALFTCFAAQAQEEVHNPLITPQKIRYIETEQRYFNMLFVGIDYGHTGYWGSFGKRELLDCHADAMLIASLNLDTNSLNLISLPRDTLTYVPGVRGIYKLNGAINCGNTLDEGLKHACDAASWLLGGIEVSKYCAVDMNTMIALGDAIGGVDFDLDMSYTGHSGKKYYTGMQHLDGLDIMDYLRARKNATRAGTDIGRTGRQRALMVAIFTKIRENPELIFNVLSVLADEKETMLTNVTAEEMTLYTSSILAIQPSDIGSFVMTGSYNTALDGWNFTFTDQKARLELIKTAFGVEVEPIPYVSRKYCTWLVDTGFRTIRYIRSAQAIYEYGLSCDLSSEQKKRLDEFAQEIEKVALLFDTAADTLSNPDRTAMEKARKTLRNNGESLMEELNYSEKINWSAGAQWYTDTRINEYQYKWQ